MDSPKPELTDPTNHNEVPKPLDNELDQAPVEKKGKRNPILILVVLLLMVVVAGTGYYIYSNHKTPQAPKAEMATKSTSVTNPYAGWNTYSSAREKATFKYPSNWAITKPTMVSNDSNNTDQIGIKSPSGKITISYVTTMVGFGDEHTATFPLNTIISKTPIPNAPDLYVISGTTTLDGSTYYPWIAVQDSDGLTNSGVAGNVVTFTSHWATDSPIGNFTGILFSTSGARTNQNSPALTKAQANAWFSNSEAQQTKRILLSFNDAANPAVNWYLYDSPGNHYSVRLPDGWNLIQNGTDTWSPLETYYTGSGDPLALKPGTKATVTNEGFGKDGNPIISFQWYDFSQAGEDAQKLLDSFSTSKSLQKEASFTTDSGKTVDKYYMNVTTPPQSIMQPQVGAYYEYVIKNSTGFVLVFNWYPPSNPTVVDRHDVVEAAIKTLLLNN